MVLAANEIIKSGHVKPATVVRLHYKFAPVAPVAPVGFKGGR